MLSTAVFLLYIGPLCMISRLQEPWNISRAVLYVNFTGSPQNSAQATTATT